MDKPDRRIEKTKQSVLKSFSDLLQERKYVNITIQDIIDRANVGRTTFYSHFPTKDDLLFYMIDTVFSLLNKQLMKYLSEDCENGRFIPVAEVFAHIKGNKRIIKGMINSDVYDLIIQKYKGHWSKEVEKRFLQRMPEHSRGNVPADLLANHFTSTLIELAKWWIATGMRYTPEQMEVFYWSLVMPSVSPTSPIPSLS